MDTNISNSPKSNWPKRNGMTVPEGYFEDFTTRMMAKIPDEVIRPAEVKRSTWQIIKPYAYMAALFAGAYLMLNIFNIGSSMRQSTSPVSSASMQDLLADVVNTNTFAYLDDYISMSDSEVYDDLFNEGFEIPDIY